MLPARHKHKEIAKGSILSPLAGASCGGDIENKKQDVRDAYVFLLRRAMSDCAGYALDSHALRFDGTVILAIVDQCVRRVGGVVRDLDFKRDVIMLLAVLSSLLRQFVLRNPA